MPEEGKLGEVTEKKDMEGFPRIEIPPEDKKPEATYKVKKKRHRLRNWAIGLSALAAVALAGDYYLQEGATEVKMNKDPIVGTDINLHTNYDPGRGYKLFGFEMKLKGQDMYNRGTAKVGEIVRLEERITTAKEFTGYEEHKTLYKIGGYAGLVGIGALGMYLFMRKKKH